VNGMKAGFGAVLDSLRRDGADGCLSQTSVPWGSGGRAFVVSHQTVAISG